MTKSTITRERVEELASGQSGFNLRIATLEESQQLARMALAAMDSEPDCKERKLFCSTDTARMRKVISVSAGTGDAPLYLHAQQPVVQDGIERVASMVEYLGNFAAAAIIRQLAANQPQNAPQNIPEIIPDCWCRTCRPVGLNDMRFVVCPDCGNKRCPRANDHRNACTGSNEPGQEGSAYPAAPQEVPDGK